MPDLDDLLRDKMAAILEPYEIRYSEVHYLICPFVGTTAIMYTNAANTKRLIILVWPTSWTPALGALFVCPRS